MINDFNQMVWREVILPRPFTEEDIWDILTHLASLSSRSFVIWEARYSHGRMHYLIGTSAKSASRVQEVFESHGDVQFLTMNGASRRPVYEARQLKISHPILPLNTERVASMKRATLAAMSGTKGGEESVLQIILGATIYPSAVPKQMADPNANFIDIIRGKAAYATAEQRSSAKEKASQYGFECVVRVGMTGQHATSRIFNIVSALRMLENAGVHVTTTNEEPCNLSNATIPLWRLPLKLSVKEVACFSLLPSGEDELPAIPGIHPKQILTPRWLNNPRTADEDRTFAVSLDQPPKKLSVSPRDSLEHMFLLGGTGSGKSTAMMRLIMADISAGKSVLVIDPKADLVTNILECIPEERADDVVVLSPADECPVGFNPLEFNQDPSLTADTILAVLQEIFSNAWGIRTADVLGASLNTLARTPGATLLWLTPLLTDDAFRKKITSKINDPIGLEPFWRHYEEMRDAERRTEIAPVMNKIRAISTRPGLRNVLGQSKPKFSLMDLFTKRRIVLVPLNKGLVGTESARLLGSLIVGIVWSLALSRAKIPQEKRHIVSVFIDELQDYLALPTSFSDALAQARGLGVGYTVAHQYRAQLPPDIKAGIDANCRNKIVFGLNADDAKDIAAQAPGLEPIDFMTLPRYSIYTTFQSGGKSTGWVSGRTLPPLKPIRMAAELQARSSERYGCDPKEVESELLKIMRPDSQEPDSSISKSPIGRKKRQQ